MTRDIPRSAVEGLVGMFLDERLQDASEPPGVREAIVVRLFDRIEDMRARTGEQMGQLRSPSGRRIPDAYFHDEEEVENSLQTAAAGIRTATALAGRLVSDARRFEAWYASMLAPTARWAVLGEASRVPRPATRARVLSWSLMPIAWHENETAWPPEGAVGLKDVRQLIGADAEPVRVTEKPYVGWVQLGMFERQGTFATKYPDVPARQVLISTGLEVCDGSIPASTMPLSSGPPTPWAVPYARLAMRLDAGIAELALSETQGPLAGIIEYSTQRGAPDRQRGAGLHPFPLVPRLEIAALLGLRPEDPAVRHCLVDDQGPALVGRLWRGFLIHAGDYSPLEPAVEGADLIIRPDLYDRLEGVVGKGRIKAGITVSQYENGDVDDDEPEDVQGLDPSEGQPS